MVKRRKRMTKRKAAQLHSQRRARQRYGMSLSKQQLNEMRCMIQHGKSTFLERISDDKVVHAVELDGVTYPVVYSKRNKAVLTVLPEHVLHRGNVP